MKLCVNVLSKGLDLILVVGLNLASTSMAWIVKAGTIPVSSTRAARGGKPSHRSRVSLYTLLYSLSMHATDLLMVKLLMVAVKLSCPVLHRLIPLASGVLQIQRLLKITSQLASRDDLDISRKSNRYRSRTPCKGFNRDCFSASRSCGNRSMEPEHHTSI